MKQGAENAYRLHSDAYANPRSFLHWLSAVASDNGIRSVAADLLDQRGITMYAIRVVGPSGYLQYWDTAGAGFLSSCCSDAHDTFAKAEAVAAAVSARADMFCCIVYVVNLECE